MLTNPSKGPNDYGVDGDDHINVSSVGTTHLGRLLDPDYARPFEYPHIGKFNSVRGLWGWLKHHPVDDRFRKAGKAELGRLFRSNQDNAVYVPNFLAVIAHATYIKLMTEHKACVDFKRLYGQKDFLSYSVPVGCSVRIRNGHSSVLMTCLDSLATQLDNPDGPDFTGLCKHPNETKYLYLEAHLRKTLNPELFSRMKNTV